MLTTGSISRNFARQFLWNFKRRSRISDYYMGFNGRTNKEKENHLFEKENHLNQSSIIGFHGNF